MLIIALCPRPDGGGDGRDRRWSGGAPQSSGGNGPRNPDPLPPPPNCCEVWCRSFDEGDCAALIVSSASCCGRQRCGRRLGRPPGRRRLSTRRCVPRDPASTYHRGRFVWATVLTLGSGGGVAQRSRVVGAAAAGGRGGRGASMPRRSKGTSRSTSGLSEMPSGGVRNLATAETTRQLPISLHLLVSHLALISLVSRHSLVSLHILYSLHAATGVCYDRTWAEGTVAQRTDRTAAGQAKRTRWRLLSGPGRSSSGRSGEPGGYTRSEAIPIATC